MEDKNIGSVVGQYRVVGLGTKKTGGHKLYDAVCLKCGFKKHNVRLSDLKRKNENCIHYEHITKWHSSRLRDILKGMIRRCHNVNNPSYKDYGAKGIRVCEDWRNNYQLFNDWAVANGYQEGLSIDRINHDGNYEPSNCRWITQSDNSKYKSTTNYITVKGITDSGKGWSRRLGKGINFINKMIRNKGMEYTVDFIENNYEEFKKNS